MELLVARLSVVLAATCLLPRSLTMPYYDKAMRPIWWYNTDEYVQPQQPAPPPAIPPRRFTIQTQPQIPMQSLSGQPLVMQQMPSVISTMPTQPVRSVGASFGRPMAPRQASLPRRSASGQQLRFAKGGTVGGRETMPNATSAKPKGPGKPGDYMLQPIIVGEAGKPEMLLVPRGSQVIPMSDIKHMSEMPDAQTALGTMRDNVAADAAAQVQAQAQAQPAAPQAPVEMLALGGTVGMVNPSLAAWQRAMLAAPQQQQAPAAIPAASDPNALAAFAQQQQIDASAATANAPAPVPWYEDKTRMGQIGTAAATIGGIFSKGNPIAEQLNKEALATSQTLMKQGLAGGTPSAPTAGPMQQPGSALANTQINAPAPVGSPWDPNFRQGVASVQPAVAPENTWGLTEETRNSMIQEAGLRQQMATEQAKLVLEQQTAKAAADAAPTELAYKKAMTANAEQEGARLESAQKLQLDLAKVERDFQTSRDSAQAKADIELAVQNHQFRLQEATARNAGKTTSGFQTLNVGKGGSVGVFNKATGKMEWLAPPGGPEPDKAMTGVDVDRVLKNKIGSYDSRVRAELTKKYPIDSPILADRLTGLNLAQESPNESAHWLALWNNASPELRKDMLTELKSTGALDTPFAPIDPAAYIRQAQIKEDAQAAGYTRLPDGRLQYSDGRIIKFEDFIASMQDPKGRMKYDAATAMQYYLAIPQGTELVVPTATPRPKLYDPKSSNFITGADKATPFMQ